VYPRLQLGDDVRALALPAFQALLQ
jgi:hypothetical protein